MPDYVENKVIFHGDENEIKDMLEYIKDDEDGVAICFEKIIPIPDELNVDEEYKWLCENWGTKWDVCEEIEYENENEIGFTTANDPPHGIIHRLSTMYPNITIEHIFGGDDLKRNVGRCVIKDGVYIEKCIYDDNIDDAIKFCCEQFGYEYDEVAEDCEDE